MMSEEREDRVTNVKELLDRAKKPSSDALRLHPFYRGKIETALKCAIRDFNDFAIWYTPGVAAACKAISAEPEMAYELTNKWNTVAVVSDGTRVLGLGDIGPLAGLPVMEGKALLYKYLGGVDGVPIMLDTKDPDRIIDSVLMLQPSFGGINLEDISQPKCFRVLDMLREHADIPIWHDDQQGTATVTLAALVNALKVVGKKIEDMRIAFIGCGAANIACARLILGRGADPGKCILVDTRGIIHSGRRDIELRRAEYVDKWRLSLITNEEGREGGIPEAMRGVDVVIALAQSGPGVILPQWVRSMNSDAIIFACANPVPEIWPWEAKEAGAAIVATGRSDFPNQVNNSIGFPGIFRGALDVRARTITDEMCFAAADALAEQVGDELSADHILPTMDDWEVFPREAAAVGMKAQEQGVARIVASYDELLHHARNMIARSRQLTSTMMETGLIQPRLTRQALNGRKARWPSLRVESGKSNYIRYRGANMYDLIVLGGGPAGLTATIYAVRKRLNVLLVTKDLGGKTNYHPHLEMEHGYQAVRGAEVVDKFKRELLYLDFVRLMDVATEVRSGNGSGGFVVKTKDEKELHAKAVIVATGAGAARLNIPGETKFMGRGVYYSALSYAPLFMDKTTAVIGNGLLALRAAAELALTSTHVYLIGNERGWGWQLTDSPLGRKLASSTNVTIMEGYDPVAITGTEFANRLVLRGPVDYEDALAVDAIFVEQALVRHSEMVANLVELDQLGCIKVDDRNCTNVPGLFAAGDVTDTYAEQVLVAIGEGVKAALSAYDYLLPAL
jgi:malate dehydrogenase (oxaloacetate-decarboxylating)